MTNPTSNFGWQMPTSTDLVTDLPADFEVFGQAVDTSLADLKGGTSGQVLAKNSNTDMDFIWVAQDDSNAIQNAIVDAKGDLIAASAADTPARLAVGANNTVLTADSSTATGLKWAAPASAGASFTLLNAGGTALTGATTITVSGISGQNQIFVYVSSASSVNASAFLLMKFNSAANGHYYSQTGVRGGATYTNQGINDGQIYIAGMGNAATNIVDGWLHITGTNTTGVKPFYSSGRANGSGTDTFFSTAGHVSLTSTISSIDFISSTGNWDAGTVYVYGSAN